MSRPHSLAIMLDIWQIRCGKLPRTGLPARVVPEYIASAAHRRQSGSIQFDYGVPSGFDIRIR
jgi:hypothetical protein